MNQMRLRLLSLIISLVFPLLCAAQEVVGIRGSVSDSKTGEPLAGAFVAAYKSSKVQGYSMTGEDGTFHVKLSGVSAPDTLVVTLMGYASRKVAVTDLSKPLTIKLIPKKAEIKASKITSSVIEENGDTTKYSAAAFSDGNERNIGDLLAKLPGLSVTESGGVKVDGQSVSKFYVEGMDLMGARYGTVVKNLTPDKISSVEVYRRHQPVRALSGLVATDKSAVNIILKESSRGTWLFSGGAALGAPRFPLFNARAMFSRFSSSSQNLYLLKGNNIGGDILQELREQEYFGRASGRAYVLRESLEPDFATPLTPTNSPLSLPKEYWYANTSGVASLNSLRKLKSGMLVRTTLNAAAERYSEQTASREEIIFPQGDVLTISESTEVLDKKLFLNGSAELENNNDKRFFSDRLEFSGQLRDNDMDISREEPASERRSLPSFKVSNNLSSIIRLSDKKALDIGSDTKFFRNEGKADFSFGQSAFRQVYDISRLDSRNTARFDARAGRQVFHVTARLNVAYTLLESSLSGLDLEAVPTYSRNGILHLAPGATVSTDRRIGKSRVSLSLPASLNLVSTEGVNMIYPLVSPSVSASGPLAGKLDYTAILRYSLTRSSDESLSRAAVARSYRAMAVPDSLMRSGTLGGDLFLKYSDNVSLFYATLSSGYDRMVTDKTSSAFYHDRFSVSSFVPAVCAHEILNLNGNIKKFFGLRALVLEARAGTTLSTYESLLQGTRTGFKDRTFMAGLTLRSNPWDWISAEVKADGFRLVSSFAERNRTDRLSCDASPALRPWKKVSLITDSYLSWYTLAGKKTSNPPLVSAEAVWKLAKCSLYLRCMNVFDSDVLTTDAVSAYQSFHSSRQLLGRRILAGVRMSL